jgi:hypothetical protein
MKPGVSGGIQLNSIPAPDYSRLMEQSGYG